MTRCDVNVFWTVVVLFMNSNNWLLCCETTESLTEKVLTIDCCVFGDGKNDRNGPNYWLLCYVDWKLARSNRL